MTAPRLGIAEPRTAAFVCLRMGNNGTGSVLLAEAVAASRDGGAAIVIAANRGGMAGVLAAFASSLRVLPFPPWDTLPYDRSSPSAGVSGARLATLAALAPANGRRQSLLVVTTARAALQRLPSRASVSAGSHTLRVGDHAEAQRLRDRLVAAGYAEAEPANDPGEIALREGLIDVYPPGAARPVRIEIADGRIVAMRPYDPLSQRSQGDGRAEILLPPGAEIPWDTASRERFVIAWRNRFGVAADAHPLVAAVRAGRHARGAEHWLPLFCDRTETLLDYVPDAPVYVDADGDRAAQVWLEQLHAAFAMRHDRAGLEAESGLPPYNPLAPEDTHLTQEQWRQMVVARGHVLTESLPEPPAGEDDGGVGEPGGAAEVAGIGPGDLVIHGEHGLGLFDGFEVVEAEGLVADCLRLLYAKGDKLLVPAENADQVHAYGGDSRRLDHLGTAAWPRRRQRLKEEIGQLAGQLVATMAARDSADCPAMPVPADYRRFADRFPHEETRDKRHAIRAVLDDLGSCRPMDRLVCGDVGFGKTEVALRAAFVVAAQGRQVAIIAPTTPLCRQHYDELCNRLSGWPWRIAHLSRVIPAAAGKRIKDELQTGEITIAVGTQALLEAKFARLGLVVVDEEQRLGVRDKERLKEFGPCTHVLTMTATPIPRTLHLATAGLRDLSLIRTAPVARRPVRTFVLAFDPVTLRQALLRERNRGGQSLCICPRIHDIAPLRDRLAELVPEFDMAVVHGRLAPRAMEDTLAAFANGDHDILLATNIVETGLNLPGANTLIVHRAEMFGLAALHQLRGRVGRGAVQAYCYLTTEPGVEVSEVARRRLEAIATHSHPGAGFQLALADRDLRGSGSLLGEAQAGHFRDIGAELLEELMREAVAEARGESIPAPPAISLGASARLPETYIADPAVRLGFYRRLAKGDEPTAAIAAELTDRFGPPPPEVDLALAAHQLGRLCRGLGISALEAGPKGAVFSFANDGGRDAFLRSRPDSKLRSDGRVAVRGEWSDAQHRADALRSILAGHGDAH